MGHELSEKDVGKIGLFDNRVSWPSLLQTDDESILRHLLRCFNEVLNTFYWGLPGGSKGNQHSLWVLTKESVIILRKSQVLLDPTKLTLTSCRWDYTVNVLAFLLDLAHTVDAIPGDNIVE